MFDIEYKGANSVVVSTKKTRVVFDPKLSLAGGKDVNVADDVEVLTEDRFVVEKATPKLLFDRPGEYEVGDVSIKGVPARRHIDTEDQGLQTTIYRIVIGGVRMALIGNVAPKLDDDQLEAIGVVDIVIIPIGGGGYTLDAKDASFMVRQIEPRAVIPIHYADENLTYEVPQEGVDKFIEELGAGIVEPGQKYRVKGDSSIPEQLTVIQVARS